MPAEVHLKLLETVRIASPCPVRWEQMTRVDDRDAVRHCDRCDLRVHNLSVMSFDEAEMLIARAKSGTGRVCAGMFRRADGTVILRDCPMGLAAARARVVKLCGRIAAAIMLVVGAAVGSGRAASPRWEEWGWAIKLKNLAPVQWVKAKVNPPPIPPGRFLAGDIACPAPSAPQPPTGAGDSPYGPHVEW